MSVLAIIPARGGSKGVPRKNLRDLAGKPLIAWTIEVALSCTKIDRIITSTDDEEIAAVASEYGSQVPFIRPSELARDDTPDLPVYLHAVDWLAKNENYFPDTIVWLRPTAPLRIKADVEEAINKMIETGADCVRSLCLAEHHPYWMKFMEKDDRLVEFIPDLDLTKYYRRQLLPAVYRLNGAVDVTRRVTVQKYNQLFHNDLRGYLMPTDRSIDLDTEMDFLLAEILLKRRTIK